VNAQFSAVDGEVVRRRNRVVRAVLERAVLDQLGVDASITRIVDVLQDDQLRHLLAWYGTYLVEETISIWMTKLASNIASR
jgi:hypothetical protein